MPRLRLLALVLIALGLALTAAIAAVPERWQAPAAGLLLVGVPLAVGGLGALVGRAPRHRSHPAEVPVPPVSHAPLVALLVALDLAPIALAGALGGLTWSPAGGALSAPRLALTALALPLVGFVSVVGWEWGLRARLYALWSEAGRPRRGALVSVLAGGALGLPVLAPGITGGQRLFVAGALATALLREAISVRLFRRAGVLLSGAFRGGLAAIDGLLVADALAIWTPLVTYAPAAPPFWALRAAGPALAALVAWLWLGRLDRRDAERRRRP